MLVGGTRPPSFVAVEEALGGLPQRYLGAPRGHDVTYHFVIADLGRTWEVRLREEDARVRRGVSRDADVVVGLHAATGLELVLGERTGIEAFFARDLSVRGDLELAIAFEGMFRRPDGTPPMATLRTVGARRRALSVLTVGSGPDVLLLHGLGSSKLSFLETAATLGREYRVHALDLPGFGASDKPAVARYDARYFAEAVVGFMDADGIASAHLVGNSMGGRVALEVGLEHPDRVRSLGLLCPAVAFVRRPLALFARLSRPELAMLPHRFHPAVVAASFRNMFGDPGAFDPHLSELAVADFQRAYRSARARHAFMAAGRSIYLDAPFGAGGFYPRLGELVPPALFVWGSQDRLISAALSDVVADWLPSAEQVELDGCGHVPQIERPGQTLGLLRRLFARADGLGAPRRAGDRFARRGRRAAA